MPLKDFVLKFFSSSKGELDVVEMDEQAKQEQRDVELSRIFGREINTKLTYVRRIHFSTLINELTFEALWQDDTVQNYMSGKRVVLADENAQKFKSTLTDKVYRLEYSNEPVFLSVNDIDDRADVIVTNGDIASLKAEALKAIEYWENMDFTDGGYQDDVPYEALVETNVNDEVAIRFRLLYGNTLNGKDNG